VFDVDAAAYYLAVQSRPYSAVRLVSFIFAKYTDQFSHRFSGMP